MANYNIRELKSRHLRTPPVSHRRLENSSLEIDVPLEHLTDEVLPLVSHETLGVGYGFDRLYAIDLKADKPIPYPLPSRHELTKYYRDQDPQRLAYGGVDMMYGGLGRSTSTQATWYCANRADYDNFANDGIGGANNNQAVFRMHSKGSSGSPLTDMTSIANAFIGNGVHGDVSVGYRTQTQGTGSSINLDPTQMNNLGLRSNRNLYQMMYANHSPLAWETILADREMWAEVPKLLPYLDKAFFSLYERGRMSSFLTRVRNPDALIAILSMVEAMYAIRMGRFSKNVSPTPQGSYHNLQGTTGSSGTAAITNGVVNHFFSYMENGTHSTLIAPWWLIQKLSHVLYEDTERDEEIRDVERGDITQFYTLLTEAMEVERGLTHSSDSNLPMLLFEKYAEGKVRDFSNFKDTTSALAATLLGFNSPRDAYYDRANTGIGRVPYFSSLLTSSGTIIGKEHAEFTDRIKEQSEHTFLSPSSEGFKQGMQYANGFDYTSMVTRTRFGDHSMELKIHPFGWFRGVKNNDDAPVAFKSSTSSSTTDFKVFKNKLNLVFYPIYNWGQLASSVDTHGLLPKHMNGAAYATSLKSSGIVEYAPGTPTAQPLWPSNYHRPGVDNYSALLMRSTDEMFMSWIDRGDTVRAEGAVFPTFTPVNMMAEMTFTTPLAMFQRNFPYLRKMLTRGSTTRAPVPANKSFDFMTVGDNYFGMSQYHNTVTGGSGPFALRNRDLFNTASHLRTDEVQLASAVVPLTNTPENWVALFQTRDALYFLTSLLSEPIMDAYTSSTTTSGATNGYGSARLMVYQGPKTFEGIVEDVFCTPITGVGTATLNYHDGSVVTSVHPGAGATAENNYVMFLLSPARMTTGEVLAARTAATAVLPSDGTTALQTLPSTLSEEDFVPGLHWAKKAFTPWPQEAGVDLTWGEAFSTPNHLEAQATGPQVGYMAAVSGITNSYKLGPGNSGNSMDFWRLSHGQWLETIRSDLEFQRASPTFYVFDLDITDIQESMLRSSLFPLGKTTIGPLTFVGGLGAEGQQTLSESVTGPTVFEIIDLSTGAGDMSMVASDPDDEYAGEENPSMHIASAVEV